jgi:Domain of unknown function (DUF4157)
MRIFLQKPKGLQQVTPAKSTASIVQRRVKANAANVKGDAIIDSDRFDYDFSRIPVHANAYAEIQPKAAIGGSKDIYEQEADRAAEQVMNMPEPTAASKQKEESNQAIHNSNQTLSSHEKSFFESRFGHDFSQVRIHTDAKSAEKADALNAEAFTIGRDIYFGAGKRGPRTRETDNLLAHELAHVVQQSHTGPVLQRKLKITGTPDNLSRTVSLLNAGFGGFYSASIDKSGAVKIEPIAAAHRSSATGPTAQQSALAERLTTVINDPKDVIMTVSAGSSTLVGSWNTADFDINDIEKVGVGSLIHEIVEQHQKQAKGVTDFGSATTGAHGEASKAESEVSGLKRGADKVISMTQNPDGTVNGVIETTYTAPGGKVKIMVSTIKNNNIESITWK